jgi:hypothetical protein
MEDINLETGGESELSGIQGSALVGRTDLDIADNCCSYHFSSAISIRDPPPQMQNLYLYTSNHSHAVQFRKNIRA